jgi:hypothetical protein
VVDAVVLRLDVSVDALIDSHPTGAQLIEAFANAWWSLIG